MDRVLNLKWENKGSLPSGENSRSPLYWIIHSPFLLFSLKGKVLEIDLPVALLLTACPMVLFKVAITRTKYGVVAWGYCEVRRQ